MEEEKKAKAWIIPVVLLLLVAGVIGGVPSLREKIIPNESVVPVVEATPAPADCTTLGHSWIAADCITPELCSRCGVTRGAALGHDWEVGENTKTCTRCGISEAIPTPEPTEAPQAKTEVDVLEYDESHSFYTVQVSTSVHERAGSRAVTCVGRLRKAGYNAFVVHSRGNSAHRYTICVGVFADKAGAMALANELRAIPPVKGTATYGAYATMMYCADTPTLAIYENAYWQ